MVESSRLPMKKRFGITLAVVASIALTVFAIVLFLFAMNPCGNQVVFERSSPNRIYRAIVFDRDCGATTAESTQISVLRSGKDLGDRASGNCVVFSRGASGLEFEWVADKELVIEYRTVDKPLVLNNKCNGVSVRYRAVPH